MAKHVLFMLLALTAVVAADIPHLLNVQGLLTDAEGNPLPDRPYSVVFTIYDAETDGSALWTETRSVATVGGLFTIYLGQSSPLSPWLFNNVELWLGIAVEGEPEMTPRQRLAAVPYVFRAVSADTAGFAFAIADDAVTSSEIVNGSIQLEDIGQNGANTNQVIKWNGSAWTAADDETGSSSGNGWVDDGSVVRLASGTDSVGIGTGAPAEKLHVNGDIRLNSSSSIAFGSDNSQLRSSSTDMVFTADDDIHLQPDDDIYVRRDGGSAWVHFDNSSEKLGVGITDPPYKLTVNGEVSIADGGVSKYHINYYQGGLNFAETGVQDRRIHIGDGGNVGIGTAVPGAKLGVNGDLKVNGAYKGNISSSTDTDGAPFPRPAYDSGWFEFYTGTDFPLNHNIGGDSSNYVVDLQFKHNGYMGVHNRGHGIDLSGSGYGAAWYGLTSSMITITPAPGSGLFYVDSVRVRIWVVK